MLREYRTRIAIADESDSAEHAPTHGMVDVAAALASDAWGTTPLAKAVTALSDAFQDVLSAELKDPFGRVEFAREEMIRYGARLGFALARTVSAADRGWVAWMTEAESWLRAAECGVGGHQSTQPEYVDEFGPDLDQVKAARLRGAEKPSSDSPAIFRSMMEQMAAVGLEVIENHERRHHAEPATPAQEPSTPKARPTVQPRDKQAAGSRAAASPPVRHRAADIGHIAAAVPPRDHCAGDDLELAGHRHPRASDPWFAEHGVG